MRFSPSFAGLSCFACGTSHDPNRLQTVCTACGLPIRVDYRLRAFQPSARPSLWRYDSALPVSAADAVTLSEGWTPLVEVERSVVVKDEARNPTGSFKARGMTLAVTMAKALGAKALVAPSAGNAAGALAAYGAAAGLPVTVAMPEDPPRAFGEECRHYGAQVHLTPGTIADAGKWLKANGPKDAFDISTLKEPYRVEGKKTMAYELFEQLGELPDVIVYPTGGGTGLVGMWKAFEEMEALGGIGPGRARMVSVQAAGCAPIVRAWEEGTEFAAGWDDAHTYASGLRVPKAVGDFLILAAVRASRGAAVAVDDAEMRRWTPLVGADTGIFCAPGGAATAAAVEHLRRSGHVGEPDRVVLFNTGSGLKYVGM